MSRPCARWSVSWSARARNSQPAHGLRIVLRPAMRSLLFTLLVACNSSTSHPDATRRDFNNCSWRDPQFGSSTCVTDVEHSGQRWCTCEPGATCTYENFENGCDCHCAAIGSGWWWSCTPDEPFSSPCPITPPIDAGVLD